MGDDTYICRENYVIKSCKRKCVIKVNIATSSVVNYQRCQEYGLFPIL